MEETQKQIIDQTTPLIRLFSWKSFLVNVIAYTVIVGLIFYLLYGWQTELMITIVVLVVVYSLLKDWMMQRQTKRIMKQQMQYVGKKYPSMVLYLPILDQMGRTTLLKRAALVFTDQWLFLEAFNQKAFSATPSESIKVPYGKGFTIQSFEIQSERKLITFQATLMDQSYQFLTTNHEEVVRHFQKIIPIQKEHAHV